MVGITYRGKHSWRDMGVLVKTISRPALAPVRSLEETIPFLDGSLDYSGQNGRLYYDDKILELEFSIHEKNSAASHRRIARLAAWLAGGYDDLIFDDMPQVRWRAKPADLQGVSPELLGRLGRVSVTFRCKPYNLDIYDSTPILLGADILLGDSIRIGWGQDCVFSVNGSGTFVHYNFGDAPARPKIKVSGASVRNLILDVGGKVLRYPDPFTSLAIDCETWRCTDAGTDVTRKMTGQYPELAPGKNTIRVTCTGNAVLELIYYPNYLYGKAE